MQPDYERGHARTLRLTLAALSLLVLLAVVAFASRSSLGHTSGAQPTPTYVSWAMSVFLIIFVALIPFAVYSYSVQMREFRSKQDKSFQARVARSLAIILIFVIVGGVAMYLRLHHQGLFRGLHLPGAVTGRHHDANHPGATYQPTFQYPVLWASLVVLAAAVGFLYWRHSRRVTPELVDQEPTMAEDVAAGIADAIDDLEAEPDARRAVIAAYARMEAVFARHGMQRKESETPVEYLRRLLLDLTSRTEAVRRLTDLFEQAKFSLHEIDGTMKQEAIDALRAIRDDLQAQPA
jgi:hypothetical protein